MSHFCSGLAACRMFIKNPMLAMVASLTVPLQWSDTLINKPHRCQFRPTLNLAWINHEDNGTTLAPCSWMCKLFGKIQSGSTLLSTTFFLASTKVEKPYTVPFGQQPVPEIQRND